MALRTRSGFSLDPNATFVVSGEFGGLGRNIACWLADQGARHLLLLSRSGGQSEKGKELVKYLELKGVMALAPACDVSDGESVKNALRESGSQMPRIKGCIQAAMAPRVSIDVTLFAFRWANIPRTLVLKKFPTNSGRELLALRRKDRGTSTNIFPKEWTFSSCYRLSRAF